MSYRTFKRALGETNLERKCRLLFGASLLVLITGSFWWYGSQTDKLVYERNRFAGEQLVTQALFEAHVNVFGTDLSSQLSNRDLVQSLLDRKFAWMVFLPENDAGIGKPRDPQEWIMMEEWTDIGQELKSDDEIAQRKIETELWKERPPDQESTYRYYQPIFAKESCVVCHRDPIPRVGWPDLKVGQLLGMVCVEFNVEETLDAQAWNRALFLVAAIVTVFLSMVALYVIVRYVIVKPLRHLRDVSDAVRRGDVEQRASIHTGDEFEDLGAAFNRMLRQLLRQQDELRDVNAELDGKLDELAQTNMRLFEMNQMKSDFLATVSHELRTPLNSILGFSDLLCDNDRINEKQNRYAGNIQRSGRQLLEMINDILDMAKIESGKMNLKIRQFDLATVVVTQCNLAQPLSERKKIDLQYHVPSGLKPLIQDQGKLEQIINNLLSNAIKFTPDGGRIDVKAWRDGQGDLRLSVTDTGVGISQSEQVLVFEKFRQGTTLLQGGTAMTREYSGTGLGLSIVRELCRLLGGDIGLESELGKGSIFTIHLPWELIEQTHMQSGLEDELRQLTKPRPDLPMAAPIPTITETPND
jgi:two-component system, NarL family, sensor histidine kinase BarA